MSRASRSQQAWYALRILCVGGVLVLSLCVAAVASAQSVLLDEVHTIAASDQGVPIEHSFNITAAGTYSVTLTDLGLAANPNGALAAVKLAITSGSTIVGTPLSGPGTTTFTATAGAYVVRVIGMPGDVTAGSGPFNVQITNTADNSVLTDGSFSDTLAVPAAASPSVAVLNDTFTVPASDTYQVALVDQQFPLALNIVEFALTAQGSSSLLASLGIMNGTPASPQIAAVPLQPDTTYSIFAFGQQATGGNAGLYTVVVRDSHGTTVYSKALAVGATQSLGTTTLAAGQYTLSYTDLNFPASLAASGNGTIVLLDDQVQGKLTATGSSAFNAVAGSYQAFGLGTAAATPGAGSYDVEVTPSSGPPALSAAEAVTVSGSTLQAYVYSTPIAAAGTYSVQLVDFQLPQALGSLSLAAVQAGASLASPLTASGTLNITAATGNLSMIVFAQPASSAATPLGVFGVFASPASGSRLFEAVQGVGALFTTLKVSVSEAGNYLAKVTDVGFPASFGSLYTVVTQGPMLVGEIIGSGSLPITAAAGDYFLTFIAQPSTTDEAGTYAIDFASAPPAPVVTLTASASNVASGGSATLTWSSQNASSCAASGGWSGAQSLSGSASTGALTVSTTFTLSCTGDGGTTTQAVTIGISQSSGHGGGGGLDRGSLVALLLLLAARLGRGYRTRRTRWLAAICVAAPVLVACGGMQDRLARYTSRGQTYLAHGELDKARLEFRNALQIAPSSAELRYYNGLVAEKLGNYQEAVAFDREAIAIDEDHVGAHASLGRVLAYAGLPDKALEQVNPALKKHPDDVELLTVHAIAMKEKNQVPAALEDARRAVSLDANNENALATLAGIEVLAGDSDSALKLIEAAIARAPDSADLLGVLAQVYLDRKDMAGAERALLHLTQLQRTSVGYRTQLAQVYANSNRLDQAEQTLRDAVNEMPHDNGIKRSLVEFLWTHRSHDVAEAELTRMIAAAPGALELRLMLASLYEQAKETAKAEAGYRELIQNDGTNAYGLQARDRLAAMYAAKGDTSNAEKLIGEVLDKNPADYDALALRAYQELSRGAAEAAISDLRRILRDQPDAVSVLAELAGAYVADGEQQLAEDTARHAVELDPANVAARIALARVLIAGEKYEESRTILAQLQKQHPDDALLADLQYRCSMALHDLKAAQAAAADYMRLQPESPVGPVYMGVIAEASGRVDEALADYRGALAMEPRAVEPLTASVRLLERVRRFDEANQMLEEHARLYPNSNITPFLQGEVWLARGNHLPQAEAAFRQALTVDPSSWGAYHGLAVIELARNSPAKAATVLHEAGLHARLTELDRLELAVLLAGIGYYEQAMEQYEAALKLNPKSTGAAAGLAFLLVSFRTDDVSQERALGLVRPFASSSDWRLLDAYGWVQFKNGDVAAALPPLEKAAAQQPDASQVRFHLAMAQLQSGQAKLAEQNLAAAVSHNARFFGHDEAQAVLAQLRNGKANR